MRTQIEGLIEDWFLPYPDTILDDGVNRATHRAVRTDGTFDFDFPAGAFGCRVGLADDVIRQLAGEYSGPGDEARTFQKRPPIHRRELRSREAAETWTSCRDIAFGAIVGADMCLSEQHDPPPPRTHGRYGQCERRGCASKRLPQQSSV